MLCLSGVARYEVSSKLYVQPCVYFKHKSSVNLSKLNALIGKTLIISNDKIIRSIFNIQQRNLVLNLVPKLQPYV